LWFLLLALICFLLWPKKRTPLSDSQFSAMYGPLAVIAGASEGLGSEHAKAIAAKGLNVLLIARNEQKLKDFCENLQKQYPAIKVDILVLDLNNPYEIVIEKIKQRISHLGYKESEVGLFVFNAAAVPRGSFLYHSLEEQISAVNVNVACVVALTHYFGNTMKERKKSGIVLMSSMSSASGAAGLISYASTKAFIKHFTEGIWYEYKKFNIDVLCPILGATLTPNYTNLTSKAKPSAFHRFLEGKPQEAISEIFTILPYTNDNGPYIVCGTKNKIFHFLMTRIYPRKLLIQIHSKAILDQYVDPSDYKYLPM